MTEDIVVSENHTLKESLVSIITETGLSSVEAMSEQLETTEDVVTELIQSLVDEGAVFGKLTEDHKRFFRSDVKKSELPAVSANEELDIVSADRGYAVYVPVTGLLVFIAGQVLHNTIGVVNDGQFYTYTSGIVMGGLILLILGLMYIATIDSRNQHN
jgi:hypothetical protein